MAEMQPKPTSYRTKLLSLPDGRQVPVVMQAANGPCPLLALANVLLLRGVISLPIGPPDISEEQLVSIVAGHLLDRNNPANLGKSASAEFAANLEQNLADAVSRLPKLTTGIDINPRFHDCRAYEFTDEVAIFDLLGVPLLHGWLVDPQDEDAVQVISNSSYNELLSRLIAIMGDGAVPTAGSPAAESVSLTSPPAAAAGSKPAGSSPRQADSSGGGAAAASPPGAPTSTAQAGEEAGVEESGGSFTKRLQEALALSIATGPGAEQQSQQAAAPSAAAGGQPSEAALSPLQEQEQQQPAESLRSPSSVITPNSAAAAAFDSALITPGHSRGGSLHIPNLPGASTAAPGAHWGSPPQPHLLPASLPAQQQLDAPPADSAAAAGPAASPAATASAGGASRAAAPAESAAVDDQTEAQQAVKRLMEAAFKLHLQPQNPLQPQQDPKVAAEAQLIQDFLTTSQLTYHGLTELHQVLEPMQLAVFFRNNHFGTLCKNRDGALYLLVTDQGYLREGDVVWERLAGIDGDAQFFTADFKPYSGKASLRAEAEAAAALAAAAFSGHVLEAPPAGEQGGEPNTSADADLALALQMQEEAEAEQARQRMEQRRRQQQVQQAGQQQPSQQQQQQPSQQQQQPPPPQRQRPGSSGRQNRRPLTGQPPEKEKNCSIM